MKKIKKKITSKDKKWMYQYLDTEEVEEVCDYLDKHNLTIEIKDGGLDSRSGWSEENVILEGRDLSGNGYCFNGNKLINHVRNYREYKTVITSDEYKEYLKLKSKYLKVERFFSGYS